MSSCPSSSRHRCLGVRQLRTHRSRLGTLLHHHLLIQCCCKGEYTYGWYSARGGNKCKASKGVAEVQQLAFYLTNVVKQHLFTNKVYPIPKDINSIPQHPSVIHDLFLEFRYINHDRNWVFITANTAVITDLTLCRGCTALPIKVSTRFARVSQTLKHFRGEWRRDSLRGFSKDSLYANVGPSHTVATEESTSDPRPSLSLFSQTTYVHPAHRIQLL